MFERGWCWQGRSDISQHLQEIACFVLMQKIVVKTMENEAKWREMKRKGTIPSNPPSTPSPSRSFQTVGGDISDARKAHSSLNCLCCRLPYQSLYSLHALPSFSASALLFTDFCFAASSVARKRNPSRRRVARRTTRAMRKKRKTRSRSRQRAIKNWG